MGKASRKKQERQEFGIPEGRIHELVSKYRIALNRREFPAGPIGDLIAESYARSLFATLDTLDAGPSRDSVFRSVRSFLDLLDGELRKQPEIVTFGGKRMELACKPGCNYCCSLRITTIAPMVLYLAQYIKDKKDAAYIDALKTRIAQYRAKADPLQGRDRLLAIIACPLLVDGMCSAYYARPSGCRGHHSLDVVKCKTVYENPHVGPIVPADERRKAVEAAISFGFDHGLQRIGLDTRELELVTALDIALNRDDAFESWLRKDDVFAPARRPDLEEAHMAQARRAQAADASDRIRIMG